MTDAAAGPLRRVVLATTNAHKAREVAAILRTIGVEVVVPRHLDPVEETGETFEENATLKAAGAARALGVAALADDSGLVVAALGGRPGVRSARFAGPHATDRDNVDLLLSECSRAGLVDPAAEFVCAAVLCDADGVVRAAATGRVSGVVRGPPRGANGFGYDPVFHFVGPGAPTPGARFSELSAEAKDAVSHRGRAFRALAAALAPATLSPDPARPPFVPRGDAGRGPHGAAGNGP